MWVTLLRLHTTSNSNNTFKFKLTLSNKNATCCDLILRGTPIITPSSASAHTASTTNTNVRTARLGRANTIPVAYTQQTSQRRSTQPLIVTYFDSKITHEGDIITSSTRTGSNECKRTACAFRTTPQPAVPAVHTCNERTKINALSL